MEYTELEELYRLMKKGAITKKEFEAAKEKALQPQKVNSPFSGLSQLLDGIGEFIKVTFTFVVWLYIIGLIFFLILYFFALLDLL